MCTPDIVDVPSALVRVADVFSKAFGVSKSEVRRGAAYCVIDGEIERITSEVMFVWSGIQLRFGKRRWVRLVGSDRTYFDEKTWEWRKA